MKLEVKLVFLAVFCFYFAESVPLTSKGIEKSAADPCDLVELENIPKCDVNDKKCDKSNKQKRAKRQTLCETNPSCSYCGELIPEDLDNLEDIVAPEVVEPTYEINLNEEPSPMRLIERNIIIENDNETQYYRGYIESAANITTVIRLTNMINNTNIVNMPTTLNNTNINNIHIYQNKSSVDGGKFGLGYTEQGPCCFSVGAKSCKRSTAGTKCRHQKTKVCGRQCTNKIIHQQSNPCTSIPQWPYTICQPNQFPQAPAFYPPPQNFYPPPQNYPGFYPQNPPFDDESQDDDDFPLFPEDEELENPENGWIVGPEKCKVVSEDGLQIFNCTQAGVEFDHPYAKNTASESVPVKRNVRHTNPRQISMQQQQQVPYYYPVMYQPVYIQPMPMFIPQYQPQMGYYGAPQIPMPPSADPENYFEDSNEVHYNQQPKKHSRKHQPIVMDNDEEL